MFYEAYYENKKIGKKKYLKIIVLKNKFQINL